MADPYIQTMIVEPFIRALGMLVLAIVVFSVLVYCQLGFIPSCVFALVPLFFGYKLARGTSCPKGDTMRDLRGKTVLVTGANTGIGLETAYYLALWGAKVVILCRNERKARKAVSEIKNRLEGCISEEKREGGSLEYGIVDLSSIQSVRDFTLQWGDKPVHLLVNNAGVMMCPYMETEDGLEMQFGTNHIGHFALTTELLENLKVGRARVVNLSSLAHFANMVFYNVACEGPKIEWEKLADKSAYKPSTNYGISKLANIYFTQELNDILEPHGGSAYAVHPGTVSTELTRHVLTNSFTQVLALPLKLYALKTPVEGAQTTLYCCIHPDAVPGQYHADCTIAPITKLAKDRAEARKLWEISEKIVFNA